MDPRFALTWDNKNEVLTRALQGYKDEGKFTDCTLFTQGHTYHLHKLVLMTSSLYFETIFGQLSPSSPIVILKDTEASILELVIEFIYSGEVKVHANAMPAFMACAENLKIKGLHDKYYKFIEKLRPPHPPVQPTPLHDVRSSSSPETAPRLQAFVNDVAKQTPLNLQRHLNGYQALIQAHSINSPALNMPNPYSILPKIAAYGGLHGYHMQDPEGPRAKRAKFNSHPVVPLTGDHESWLSESSEESVHKVTTQSEPKDMSLSSLSADKTSPCHNSQSPIKHEDLEHVTKTERPLPALICQPASATDRKSPMSRRKSSPPIRILQPSSDDSEEQHDSEKNSTLHSSPDTRLMIANCTPTKKVLPELVEDVSSGDNRCSEEDIDRSSSENNDRSLDDQLECVAGPSRATFTPVQSLIPFAAYYQWQQKYKQVCEDEAANADRLNASSPNLLASSDLYTQLQETNPGGYWKSSLKGSLFSPYINGVLPGSHSLAGLYGGSGWDTRTSSPQGGVSVHLRCNECSRCGRLYKTRKGLKHHIKNECGVEPRFQCTRCDWRFKQKAHLLRHVARKHTVT